MPTQEIELPTEKNQALRALAARQGMNVEELAALLLSAAFVLLRAKTGE